MSSLITDKSSKMSLKNMSTYKTSMRIIPDKKRFSEVLNGIK